MGEGGPLNSLPGALIGAAVALFIVVAVAVFFLAGFLTYVAMRGM